MLLRTLRIRSARLARPAWTVGLSLLTVLLGAALAPRVAWADEAAEVTRRSATQAYEAADFERSLEQFRILHERTGDPAYLYMVGRSLEALGRPAEALASYERIPRDDLAPDLRAKLQQLEDDLRRLLRPGRLRLRVSPQGARVVVDGRTSRPTPLEPIALPPGRHSLLVEADGHASHEVDVLVPAGEEATVVVSLAPLPPERDDAFPPPAPLSPPTDGPSGWPWVTLGAGVALSATGTVVWALGERDHRAVVTATGYDDGAYVELHQRRAHDLTVAGDRKKLAGYVLWGAGGVAVSTAIVLLVLDAAPDSPVPSLDVAPDGSGATLSLGGRF